MTKMNNQELEWQSQEDARVMARYQEIMTDPTRRERAIKEAKKQAADLTKRATAMSSAASSAKKK